MLATNIESKLKEILEKKGGWLRVSDCAKLYANKNKSEETKFYRWRKQVEKGKVKDFQVLKLPGNISFIGLDSADPKTLESLISEDKKAAKSVKSGFGLFAFLKWRTERKDERKDKEIKELDAKIDKSIKEMSRGSEEAKRKFLKS